jgi:hypothetical protein
MFVGENSCVQPNFFFFDTQKYDMFFADAEI